MRYFEAALGFVFQHWNSYYRISFILGRCTKIQERIPGLYLYHPRVRLVGIRRVYKLVTSTFIPNSRCKLSPLTGSVCETTLMALFVFIMKCAKPYGRCNGWRDVTTCSDLGDVSCTWQRTELLDLATTLPPARPSVVGQVNGKSPTRAHLLILGVVA